MYVSATENLIIYFSLKKEKVDGGFEFISIQF